MNDPLRKLFQTDVPPDAAMTQRVVDRWIAHRARSRRWRRVLATIGPLTAAAALVIGGLAIHQSAQRTRQRQAGQAVALLIRDARIDELVQPSLIDAALQHTSVLLNPDQTLALLIPRPRELIDSQAPVADEGTHTP
ncbi:MAG: hypothetical protein IT445_20140 [Phycisphaeraceae bacterium]|nr:hypothetical protein [Phycisphaeraceae bacterium]